MTNNLKSMGLFEDSDEEEVGGFKTNEKYAKHYNEFRKKEILSHVKDLEESSSSDDDASTDEELVNPEFDEEFFKTLAFLKNKDPSKYEKIPNFFENVQPIEDVVKAKQRKEKITTVADHQRERLLKTDGKMSDDESQVELSYAAEQEKIRNDLREVLNDSESEDEGNLFKVREKTDDELKGEEVDYEKWLATQSGKEIKPLKDFWTNNSLGKEDKFLRDYILKQRYIRKDDESDQMIQADIIGLSDDEAEVEKQVEYEHKYNFRFEEPDNEFIKRFPRNVEDSVRAEKNKRKEQRKEREERKAKEKELKMKELRELQNIRKREIEEKLLLLKDVAGNDNLHEVLHEEDLNSDFDPNEHDKRMSKIFNDDYYGIDEGDQKPEFPDIDEELAIENWDNFDKSKVPDVDPHCEDDDFIMDCDYDPEEEKKLKLQSELIDMSKGRKRKKKISKLAELIKREKPAYDPSNEKTYAEYLDEYYALDYEDIIADQPCRFKYTECVPNDFGLTVDEILAASNKELNQWASLKKTMQNRPKNVELNDVEKYNRMRNNLDLKKKIFKSMYGEQVAEESLSEGETEKEVESSKVEVKNKKKKTSTVTSGSLEVEDTKNSKPPRKVSNESSTSKEEKVQKTPIESSKKASNQKPQKNSTESPEKNPKESQQKSSIAVPHKAPKASSKKAPSTISQSNNSKKRKIQNEKPQSASKKAKISNEPQTNSAKSFKKPKLPNNQNQSVKLENGVNIVQFKQRGFRPNQNSLGGTAIGDNRLKAFGINPKKFHSKMKYGGKNQKFKK